MAELESRTTRNRYRLMYASLGGLFVLVVAAAVFFGSPEGDDIGLPDAIERLTPSPNETVLRQARIEIDMPVGYALEIFVDNLRVPESEVFYVEGTGVYMWSPGLGQSFIQWERGEHEILLRWDTISGLPDPGEYTYTFRVY